MRPVPIGRAPDLPQVGIGTSWQRGMVPIPAPFVGIAVHVVQPPRVCRILADSCRPMERRPRLDPVVGLPPRPPRSTAHRGVPIAGSFRGRRSCRSGPCVAPGSPRASPGELCPPNESQAPGRDPALPRRHVTAAITTQTQAKIPKERLNDRPPTRGTSAAASAIAPAKRNPSGTNLRSAIFRPWTGWSWCV